MANIGLFLPPDDKLLLARIDSNSDQDVLMAVIYEQQQLEIKELIGSGLYDEIETQILAGTLTALNTTLRTYIQDALRFYVLAAWQFETSSKNTNKGAQQMSGDNSTPSDIPMLVQRVQRYKDSAQSFSERVTKYLCENSSSYPLYNNPGSGLDTIHPKGDNFTTGWNLDDGYRPRYLDQPLP